MYLPGCHFTSAVRIVHNVESTAYREENDHSHDHHDQNTDQTVQNADGDILASVDTAAEPFSFGRTASCVCPAILTMR